MENVEELPRASLHDHLVVRIRKMILSGQLRLGEKILEQELCRTFGVSRTPLREALKVLAFEGIIELFPHRGARVATITSQEIHELFPIMGALEALAGELACENATDGSVEELRRAHDEMVACYRKGDAEGYIKLNRDIHNAIFDLAGNPALTQMYQALLGRIHHVRYLAKKSEHRWREAVEDHQRMMVALEARDGALLAWILREHLRHKAEMVREALGESGDPAVEREDDPALVAGVAG